MDNLNQELFSRLTLPEQDLSKLSFCNSNRVARVKEWVESLPATRISYTGVQLYKALPELARLKTEPSTRIQMLEDLRPYVQQCIEGLSREFLNQPLILPEAGLKTATIAQALQKHMSHAYLVAARDLCDKAKAAGKKQQHKYRKPLDLAIHRAISGLGLQLLRSYQLYTPVSTQLWAQLHVLFKLAEEFQLLDTIIADPTLTHTTGCSLRQAYLRVLMMACARANQLRQSEVSALYSGLELWCDAVNLSESGETSSNNQFAVNLSGELPPMYKSRFSGGSDDDIRELETRRLITALQKHSENASHTELKGDIRIAREITPALLAHLIDAWSQTRQRQHERRLTNTSVEITVGLSNLHFFLSNEVPFRDFLSADSSHVALSGDIPQRFAARQTSVEHDPWETAFDAGGNLFPESLLNRKEDSVQQQAPIYTIKVFDTSPGGYCLDWRGEIPQQLNAGELLGVREAGRRKWSICVIRWIRQSRAATQIGIQILASKATPYGASMIQTSGENTGYLRALMLPPLKAVNQPASIITSVLPFREYCKVKLKAHGEESTIQLTERLFATGSISQFCFRELETVKPDNKHSSQGPDSFKSAWDE